MGKLCDDLHQAATTFHHWVHPPVIEVPECVRRLLEGIYPTIDWSTVVFHDGLPWAVNVVAPVAITLPGTYDPHTIHIYVEHGAWDPCSCSGLALVVHEGFHVLQYRDLLGGYGVGFLRSFIVAYLACSLSGGGDDDNEIEKPAYAHEELFAGCCASLGAPICNCAEKPPAFNPDALDQLLTTCPGLVRESSGLTLGSALAACAPVKTWWMQGVLLLFGLLLAGLIAVAKPLAEVLMLFGVGVLRGVAGIVCAAEWLWGGIQAVGSWIAGVLEPVCDWALDVRQQCVEWEETRRAECAEWKDEGSEECREWRDQGTNECREWRDNGYNKCCDWVPCSWACKALVWIASWVCIGWYWVANLVCQGWYWVANLVCQAWVWTASRTCRLFTRVVRVLTCW